MNIKLMVKISFIFLTMGFIDNLFAAEPKPLTLLFANGDRLTLNDSEIENLKNISTTLENLIVAQGNELELPRPVTKKAIIQLLTLSATIDNQKNVQWFIDKLVQQKLTDVVEFLETILWMDIKMSPSDRELFQTHQTLNRTIPEKVILRLLVDYKKHPHLIAQLLSNTDAIDQNNDLKKLFKNAAERAYQEAYEWFININEIKPIIIKLSNPILLNQFNELGQMIIVNHENDNYFIKTVASSKIIDTIKAPKNIPYSLNHKGSLFLLRLNNEFIIHNVGSKPHKKIFLKPVSKFIKLPEFPNRVKISNNGLFVIFSYDNSPWLFIKRLKDDFYFARNYYSNIENFELSQDDSLISVHLNNNNTLTAQFNVEDDQDAIWQKQEYPILEQPFLYDFSLSPDNKLLACSFEGGLIEVIDVKTKKTYFSIRTNYKHNTICFNNDGSQILTYNQATSMNLWSIKFTPESELKKLNYKQFLAALFIAEISKKNQLREQNQMNAITLESSIYKTLMTTINSINSPFIKEKLLELLEKIEPTLVQSFVGLFSSSK